MIYTSQAYTYITIMDDNYMSEYDTGKKGGFITKISTIQKTNKKDFNPGKVFYCLDAFWNN